MAKLKVEEARKKLVRETWKLFALAHVLMHAHYTHAHLDCIYDLCSQCISQSDLREELSQKIDQHHATT